MRVLRLDSFLLAAGLVAAASSACWPVDGTAPRGLEVPEGFIGPHRGLQPDSTQPATPRELDAACRAAAQREPSPAPPPAGEVPPPRPPRRPVLRYPVRLAAASGGALCATDYEAGAVVCGRSEGTQPTVFDELTLAGVDQPLGLAVHGARVYVGSAGRGSVEVFDAPTGARLFSLGQGPGEFARPNAIAVSGDGTVFVADSPGDVVKVYEADGTFRETLGGPGAGPGRFHFPVALAVLGDALVVGDQGNHRVQVFGLDGTWRRAFGEELPGNVTSTADFRGRFTRLQGLAVRGGELLVLDSYHSHVQVFDASFQSRGFIGRPGACLECLALPLDVAVTSSGAVAVADPEHRRWTVVPWGPQ